MLAAMTLQTNASCVHLLLEGRSGRPLFSFSLEVLMSMM